MDSRVSPARRAAFEVLRSVELRRGEPAALLRKKRYEQLSPADRNLATEIVYGVLRFRSTLDFVIAHHAGRPLDSIDPPLRIALRIGVYQIRFLDRVPARAAVDQSVRLARAFGSARGAPFVNAVLRAVLRHPGVPVLPSPESDPMGHLTVALSHPEWLARRYVERLGLEAAIARCQRQNETPPTYLRVSARASAGDVEHELGSPTKRVPAVPRCLRAETARVQESSLYEAGLVLVQDAGAQLIPHLVAASEEHTVLDLCAAPGGKATLLAELSRRVLAIDRRHRRTKLVRALATRLDLANVSEVTADGRKLPFDRRFPRILLDAPCSSLGTLRRNPDIKWRLREADLRSFAELEIELLRAAVDALAPGGRLVYATCSSEPEENQDVVRRILEERPELRLLAAADALPEGARHMTTPEGFFETRPERDDTDAYFAAIFLR